MLSRLSRCKVPVRPSSVVATLKQYVERYGLYAALIAFAKLMSVGRSGIFSGRAYVHESHVLVEVPRYERFAYIHPLIADDL